MKNKGISLITLVITIVVVIILAAAVILALGRNNPITDSRVATVSQTRDSLSSGILIHATNVQSNTLGELGVKNILIENSDYKIVVDDRSTDKTITKNGVEVKLYKLDDERVKEKLNIDLKNQKGIWYIDQNGLVYMVYDNVASIPSYLKENGNVIKSVENCVTYNGATMTSVTSTVEESSSTDSSAVTAYKVTYDANGGSGEMSASIGEIVTISQNQFTAPAGKKFKNWNTAVDGSGTPYNAGATISSSITLYAQWESVSYAEFSIGEQVTIKNGTTDEICFVIKDSMASEDKVTLITKYNVDVYSNYMQNDDSNPQAFSSEYYWWDETTKQMKEQYTDPDNLNVDIGSLSSDSGKYALYAAQKYGTDVGGNGRLLRKSEADELINAGYTDLMYRNAGIYWVNRKGFWLASVNKKKIYMCDEYIWERDRTSNGYVRPVVEISKSLVTKVKTD